MDQVTQEKQRTKMLHSAVAHDQELVRRDVTKWNETPSSNVFQSLFTVILLISHVYLRDALKFFAGDCQLLAASLS